MPGITNLTNSIIDDIEYKLPYHRISVELVDTPSQQDDKFYCTGNGMITAKLAKATEVLTRIYLDSPDPFRVINLAATKYDLVEKVGALTTAVKSVRPIDQVNAAFMLGIIESAFMANHWGVYLDESFKLPFTTINDVDIMARRGAEYISRLGGNAPHYIEFMGAYTKEVMTGYSDYLASTGFVFLTPSVDKYYDTHFQRLLIETLMARRSGLPLFQKNSFDTLTVFNSRFNMAYTLTYDDIPPPVITRYIKLIGYSK